MMTQDERIEMVKRIITEAESGAPLEGLAALTVAAGRVLAAVDVDEAQRDDLLDWFAEQVRTNTAQNVDYREAMEISGGKLQ